MLRPGLHPWRVRQAVHHSRYRGFASTRPIAISAGSPIEITADVIRSIHDVSGLPYGFTIPLTAIALRTIVTLPLAIYSQKKLNRRIELRPLFYHWGELIGMQMVARQKAQNIDLRKDQSTLAETTWRVQKLVSIKLSRS